MSSYAIPERGVGPTLRSALVETLFFGALVAGFLYLYVTHYGAPASALAPHLAFVGSFVAAAIGLRLVASRWLAPGLAAASSAALLSAATLLLSLYYGAVLAGLESWGRVISWKLIATYVPQAGDLIRVLGFAPWLVALGAALAVFALFGLAFAWVRRNDWARIARGASSVTIAIIGVGALGIAGAQVIVLVTEPPADRGEPIALTFFPERAAPMAQTHALLDTTADAVDREARRNYVPLAANRPRPNLVLIVGDALRGDHLGVLGYRRATTPFLSQLHAEGRMQKASQMRSVCGESMCGLLAIARSAFVHQLSSASLSLLEVLELHGYRSRMILGGDHTNFYSLREAYGPVDHYFDGSMATSTYMNDDRLVLEKLEALPDWDGRPEFIQLHLMSSHGGGARWDKSPPFLPQRNYYRRSDHVGDSADPEAVNYYDNGVLQLDAVVKAALQTLDGKGYLRDALVVITGDHGEMLGEYGDFAHSHSVREGGLRISFLLIGYGRKPAPFVDGDALTSQVDIAPTLLHEIGLPAPSNWRGQALQSPRAREVVYFQQGTKVGVYDVRETGAVLKYWRDLHLGVEHVSVLHGEVERTIDASAIAPQRWRELRAWAMPGSAAAVAKIED